MGLIIITLSLHLGKRSKSSQRIESESDSGDTNENFDSRELGDDSEDIEPIGGYNRFPTLSIFNHNITKVECYSEGFISGGPYTRGKLPSSQINLGVNILPPRNITCCLRLTEILLLQ